MPEAPSPLDEALPIAKQIAEALEAAHEQGVVHRDLKPADVKVKADCTVKVLDFGLAKALEGPGSDPAESPTVTAAATAPGMVLGTAAHMSPEQVRGRPVDKKADIWAFGVVLFEMLSGTWPFVGDDASETLARVIDREPDWAALPGSLPPVLAGVLRRIHDIVDVIQAMDGAFETSVPAPSERTVASGTLRLWQPSPPAIGIVLAAAAISALAAWSLTRPAPVQLARFTIPLADDQSFDRPVVAISSDGTRVVYAANGALWLRSVDRLEAVASAGTENARGQFFSHDSQSSVCGPTVS